MSDEHSKIKRYEKVLDLLMDDSVFIEMVNRKGRDKDKKLDEDIIMNHLDDQTRVRSDLGESYNVVEEGRDLNELDKSVYTSLKAQDAYKKYKKIGKMGGMLKKSSIIYGITGTLVGVGTFIGLL